MGRGKGHAAFLPRLLRANQRVQRVNRARDSFFLTQLALKYGKKLFTSIYFFQQRSN